MRPFLAVAAMMFAALFAASRAEGGSGAVISQDLSNAPGVQSAATVPSSATEVAVQIVVSGAQDVAAFEFELLYDPAYLRFLRWERGQFLGSTAQCVEVIAQVTVRVGCTTSGVPGVSGAGVLAVVYFDPRAPGQTCPLLLDYKLADRYGGSLLAAKQDACLTIAQDGDGDGCGDALELGTDATRGGLRDPAEPWDFFDVPLPPLRGGSASVRDRIVSIADVLGVVAYIGARSGGPASPAGYAYNADADGDSLADGAWYDRRLPDISRPWRTAQGDGAVSIGDALLALYQVGHSCLG